MIDFRYWLRLPWPNIALDREELAQIFKKIGALFAFLKFFGTKIGISALPMAKKFAQVLNSQKGQKHSKNGLFAPILTHKKQCWEN